MPGSSAVTSSDLKLIAFDADDLMVISAHLQDASVGMQDVAWLEPGRRFVAVVERLDRMCGGEPLRRVAGLHVDRVLRARYRGLTPGTGESRTLLSVTFAPNQLVAEDPGGTVTLLFSDGAGVRLDVECVEVAMTDLGSSMTEPAPRTSEDTAAADSDA